MNLMRGINLRKIANAMKGASGAESKAVSTRTHTSDAALTHAPRSSSLCSRRHCLLC